MKHKRLTILLDYDGTVTIPNGKGGLREHSRVAELIKNHRVTVYSGNPFAKTFADRHGIPFIFKGTDDIPKADVLIDDMAETIQKEGFTQYFTVDKIYPSIDAFFTDYPGK